MGLEYPTNGSNRRFKSLSAGQMSLGPEDPEFNRNRPLTLDRKSLFDQYADKATRTHDPRSHQFHPKADRHEGLGPDNQKYVELVNEPSKSPRREIQYEQDHETVEAEPKLLLQPETKAISHDQLVTEVRGIYAGLVMVEAKCIDVDEKQLSAALDKLSRSRLNPEQWQALIKLHKTLLHEHHDFFLASQHPSASSALSQLAAKYSMPARMWKHGIQAFLEVLRHRLPESLDHMLAFIYIAYSMMALLYETVPAFEDTWVECLGDMARYRMAIEDDDIRDREVWSAVARFWYGRVADKNPRVGRLYHHLAILAPPFTVSQLSLYLRAATCISFFENAKATLRTLFDPVLAGEDSKLYRSSSIETMFIKLHGLLFTGGSPAEFWETIQRLFRGSLDSYIGKVTQKFKEQGACIALANVASLFEYGVTREKQVSRSIFRLSYQKYLTSLAEKDKNALGLSGKIEELEILPPDPSEEEYASSVRLISFASLMTFGTLVIALQRIGDKKMPFLLSTSI